MSGPDRLVLGSYASFYIDRSLADLCPCNDPVSVPDMTQLPANLTFLPLPLDN
jgi:hypothetical protein